jgi:hypothetical protein
MPILVYTLNFSGFSHDNCQVSYDKTMDKNQQKFFTLSKAVSLRWALILVKLVALGFTLHTN